MWNKIKDIFKQPWYAKYRDPWYKRIYYNWINFIYYLTSTRNWKWLEVLICNLADLEVLLKLIKDKDLYEKVSEAHSFNKELNDIIGTIYIPKDELYCGNCPFRVKSKIATFFLGDDFDTYCYFLGRGDYSIINPTDLLWDGCKCCDVNTDVSEDAEVEEEEEEITFEDLGISSTDYREYYGS